MYRSGINARLFETVSRPPAWVAGPDAGGVTEYFLRKDESLVELLELFLDATTDAVRLVRASNASRAILDEYDMAELEELRAHVQASELLRVIPYPRQTDHSAHTLYLYLLGVYLFLACKPLREGIAKFLRETNDSQQLIRRFLFQWAFVSLLHDIGYIFQGRSKNEIRAVDRMFRPSYVKRLVEAKEDFRQRVGDAVAELAIKPFEPVENPEDILTLLRHLPWGLNAEVKQDAFMSFDMYGPKVQQQVTADYLEDYAYHVASSGYDGFSEGTVDHAVASGLFLLRYSTFWHALAKDFNYQGPFQAYEEYPKRDVVCACFAAAAHNIIGVHAKGLPPLAFETNPLLYLGVLCDELQKWDRFPAGERHLVDLNSFEKHCTDSERIEVACIDGGRKPVEGGWDGEKVVFRFEEEALAEKVSDALRRLDAVERFVEINPPAEAQTAEAGGAGVDAHADDEAGVLPLPED